MPNLVCDVTIPVCYQLDPAKDADSMQGLRLSRSKQNIVGFYNPIPPCLPVEHRNPSLCVVYQVQVKTQDPNEKVYDIMVKYFSEKEKVQILV